MLAGTQALLARTGVEAGAVSRFIHGTTLAVNTLLQRSGDPVGLIVTRGFRDILELRRLRLHEAQNFFVDKPEPLVPRHLVREVGERLLTYGRATGRSSPPRWRPRPTSSSGAAAGPSRSASSTATWTAATSARRPA